jgi:hypothetical protein
MSAALLSRLLCRTGPGRATGATWTVTAASAEECANRRTLWWEAQAPGAHETTSGSVTE